jgi:hypothetical protein
MICLGMTPPGLRDSRYGTAGTQVPASGAALTDAAARVTSVAMRGLAGDGELDHSLLRIGL